MAAPSLIYDPGGGPITIVFPLELDSYDARSVPSIVQIEQPAGVIATHQGAVHDEIVIGISAFNQDDAFLDAMVAFWSWAQTGGGFGFAFDSDKVVDTTLTVKHDQNKVGYTLASTAGIIVGEFYLVEDVNQANQEEVKVASISPPSLNAEDPGLHEHLIGSIFRDPDYHPRCVASQDDEPIVELPGALWKLLFAFRSFREITTP
jgi:hypothetical protein